MIDSQNIPGAVLFIVLFTGVIFLATVDSFKPLTAYIMSPHVFSIVLYFAGFTYGQRKFN
tara:strand:+ start:236 stop:415 length:180 start_codon:yes stop_codon:yes gene_type:complete